MGGEFEGECIHVYAWLSPFSVHLKLSQHCSSVIPQCKIKSLTFEKIKNISRNPLRFKFSNFLKVKFTLSVVPRPQIGAFLLLAEIIKLSHVCDH